MRTLILIMLTSVFVMSCGSSNRIVEPTADSRAVDEWVAQKTFHIDLDWAYPMVTTSINSLGNSGLLPPGNTVNSISLIGNDNHFKMDGDHVSIYLPYYGEQQFAPEYNASRGGIEFDGVPERLKISKNEKKQSHQISFFMNNGKRESSRVIVTLYPNKTANVVINSSHRTPISYRGVVAKLSENNSTKVVTQ